MVLDYYVYRSSTASIEPRTDSLQIPSHLDMRLLSGPTVLVNLSTYRLFSSNVSWTDELSKKYIYTVDMFQCNDTAVHLQNRWNNKQSLRGPNQESDQVPIQAARSGLLTISKSLVYRRYVRCRYFV